MRCLQRAMKYIEKIDNLCFVRNVPGDINNGQNNSSYKAGGNRFS